MSKSEKIPSWGHVQKEFHAEELETAEDIGWIFKEKIAKGKGLFSEIIPIDKEGKLTPEDKRNQLSLFANLAQEGSEALYKLAQDVQDKFPELIFHFENDQEGRWIKYTVREKR